MLNRVLGPLVTYLPENNRIERIWLLAKFDFLKRYYGSALGTLWALIYPLTRLFIYYFIFTVIFSHRIPNFALFLFLGLIVWGFFVEASKNSIMLFKKKRYILENIPINKLDIFYASTCSAIFSLIFNFIVYFIVSLFFSISYSFGDLLFLVLLLNLFIFSLAVSLLLSMLYLQFRDIQHLYDLVILVLFWLSGILFEIKPEMGWYAELLYYLTPMMGIIANARSVLIYDEGMDWNLFMYDYAYSILLLVFALALFRRYAKRALEYL